ncbi:pilus assembly protein [Acinetobacter indicus]|uniref:PilC/PilY family type IV pilus protein n=1 Tax=Acinetobacter indicus TaxID=756892 RepID=UPI000CEBE35C|nr:PilC/PilY family type IV pilus protein [Acinetobacter indicus]
MKLKTLVQMMAILPVIALPATTALHASDLSIYKPNSGGKTSILLMLDTSGSMGISSLVLPTNNTYGSPGDVESALCGQVLVKEREGDSSTPTVDYKQWVYNAIDNRTGSPTNGKKAFAKTVTIDGENITYYLRGCGTATIDANGKLIESEAGKFDRLSRLKDAVIQLLASQSLDDEVRIGLGHFSAKTDLKIGDLQKLESKYPTIYKNGDVRRELVDGHSGRILVPVAALTSAQRKKLIKQLASIQSIDTQTMGDGNPAPLRLAPNRTSGTKVQYDLTLTSQAYPNEFKASSGTPTAHAYAEAGAYMMGTTTGEVPRPDPNRLGVLYDGSSIIRNTSTGEQLYYVCVGLDGNSGQVEGLGATSMFCDNEWNRGMDKYGVFYDSGKKRPGDLVVIWKPNGSGGWTKVTPEEFKTEFGAKNSAWEIHKALPVGWRWGGWMKVEHEPLDIEPIGTKVWSHHETNVKNMVSYRSNPFSIAANNADNNVGGFTYSVSESKKGSNYIAGGIASQCNGNGIYFLTDGAPNSTKNDMAKTIMNRTLGDSYKFNNTLPSDTLTSPRLQATVFTGETGGWEYIGAYAKKLKNSTQNQANMSIKTAVVGFGSSFKGIPKNANGTYNCEAVKDINKDAYNACKWGSDEYGDGGFYYAENVEDIQQSILDFVSKVEVPFTATSLGSILVPRDPIDQTQVLTEGFFPMITPVDDSEAANDQKNRTWAGNLKKYKIIDGTLKSVTDQPIYELDTTTNQQVINRAAKDLWSIAASTDDHSLATSGGSLNKIPVPSLQNVIGDPSKNDSERRVFILDGTTLKRVAKDNLATDFSPTNGGLLQSLTYDASKPTDANNITIAQRYALLNYLGYSAPTGTSLTTANLTSYTVPQVPYRYLGGVVHSTPLVATKSATINAADNSIVSRDEYVVYGSMDGGLHIVDAETGVEKSVFVPKEILKNQLDTLQSSNPKGTGLAYGVDAPWALDAQYKIKNTTTGVTTTTAYEADRLNVYGGLRMGGSALYGLDIKKPESPALLFHITRSTSGFDRLAQIWSKPTIAYMRVKGVRTRVLIFGGGYDETVYERENITEPTSQTLGNALYIVNADNGNLIWSTSSSHTSTSNTVTAHSDVKYSVVGQPAIRDYDSDGLADMIYFADLGGQIFRVDLNNLAQMSTTADRNIAVRVSRIANLRENGFVPRFYERVTTGIFGQGSERHVFVSVGSGNRSFPLESTVTENKIYGILDYDAAKNGIESATYNGGFKPEATVDNIINRGVLGKTNTSVDGVTANAAGVTDTHKSALLSNATGATAKRGWSFSLRSVSDTTTAKYAKSFEEAQLVVGDLYVNLYDPKATLGAIAADDCGGGVQGLSTVHRVCAPYGDCAAYVTTDYQGIIGPTLGGLTNPARTTRLIGPLAPQGEKCIGRCETIDANDVESLKQYSQSRKIRPTRWFEW